MMLEEYSTINNLAVYIDQRLPHDELAQAQAPETNFRDNGSAPDPLPQLDSTLAATSELKAPLKVEEKLPAPGSSLERILTQQLQIMAQQIEALGQIKPSKATTTSGALSVASQLDRVARPPAMQPQPDRRSVEGLSSDDLASNPTAGHEPIKTSVSRLTPKQQ